MLNPDETEAIGAEIAVLTSTTLPELALRLAEVTEGQRERLLATLDGDPLRRPVELILRVQKVLPRSMPEEVARDVGFLLAAVPSPDADHEALLLRFLADPRDVAWKQVYADFLEERGDPRVAAVRAEVAAVEAGMSPDAVCGVLDAQRHLGVAYTPEDLGTLGEMPFSPKTLRQCKDTHVLVAGAPLSLNDICRCATGYIRDVDLRVDESFASDRTVGARWHLLRKEPLPASRGKTCDGQAALLTHEEEVPLACELVYAAILYELTHRKLLLPDVFVRCQDVISGGRRVCVGCFFFDGFRLRYDFDERPCDNLGLASSRKS